MQNNNIDNELDAATIAQLTWKPGTCALVALAIAKAFLNSPTNSVWSDTVTLPQLNMEDKNCIGTTWRRLAKMGLITRMEGATDHRRSQNKSRKGGTAWRYVAQSPALLRSYVSRNEPLNQTQTQTELALN